MNEYEAIVIGAGHNGLTCACYLARAGLKVLVLELRDAIGGQTSTKPLTVDGFMHDEHASGIQVANLSPSIHELDLEARGFERLYPPLNYAHAFADGTALRFGRTVDETCASIAQFSEVDAKAWRALMDDYSANKTNQVRELFQVPPSGPPPEALRPSVRAWVNETFESDQMKAACQAWATHVGFSPDDEGGMLSAGFGPVIQDVGNNPVRGGMQNLPNALASYLLEHGGEIRTSARVAKILTDKGRATGVRLDDGSEIRATRLVAANVNPILVARDMLTEDELGAEVATKMQNLDHALAQMTIWLALEAPPVYRCGVAADETLYIHATDPNLEFFDRLYIEARAGLLPKRPMLLFVNEGAVDPSRVPPGCCSLKLLVMLLPFEVRGDATGRIDARGWTDAAEPYADHALQLAETYAPGLSDRILARTVQDPLAMSVESPDCYQGDISHVGLRLHQSGASRPIPEMGQYRTPVAGLYLCGSGSHPGSGVTMACGRNAALAIYEDLNLGDTRGP